MKTPQLSTKLLFLLVSGMLFAQLTVAQLPYPPITERNSLQWPFSATSIWNMPVGSEAEYVPALLEDADAIGNEIEHIVLTPDAPIRAIYQNNDAADRCIIIGDKLFSAPLPDDYIVDPSTGNNQNDATLAILMPDGRTIKQTQYFSRCEIDNRATSTYLWKEDMDIYGEGYHGAHGGSMLSNIGGTLRVGELTPTSGPIRHVLKMTVCGAKNLYYGTEKEGYNGQRWPALNSDGPHYGRARTNPVVKECRMGALLALPPDIPISSYDLQTDPARILAQALQDYGAYIVDETDVAARDGSNNITGLCIEHGPNGNFDDEFLKNWGVRFINYHYSTPFSKDLRILFRHLCVIDNNAPGSIGGGGIPRAPLAPPFTGMSDTQGYRIENTTVQNTLVIQGYEGVALILNNCSEVVKQVIVSGGTIDLSGLPAGNYFLRLENNVICEFSKI